MIVVSGVGLLGPAGIGLQSLAALLARGVPALSPIECWAHLPGARREAALVPDVDLSPWVKPRKARRMSRSSLLAVVSARLAAEDAGLAPGDERAAVCLATAFGPADYTEQILKTFSECVANVGAAQVAIDRGARGPNLTVTAREAGPALVVDAAARLMRAGRTERAYALCVDELSTLTHAVLDRVHAVSRGAERAGPLASEGATALVLESAAAADVRGARAQAVVRATLGAFDPTATARGWGADPGGLAERVRSGLRRADVEPDSIDLVVASAAGAPTGDAYEAAMLEALFDDVPAVATPKRVLGEWGGGHMGAALLALGERRHRRVLVSALGAGGAAGFVVLEPAP
ncbi:MAG: beta-ketoacyl synthase N-terminal-like domain-containing protein [Planctomycetota bacterium]